MGLEWKKVIAIGIATLGATAQAAWECKMPNGLTVYRKISECPPDALLKKQIDQVPEQLPNKAPPKASTSQPSELVFTPIPNTRVTSADVSNKPPKTTASRPEVTSADAAAAVCVKLRLLGATTCEFDFNFFSASKITATVPATPQVAQLVCLGIADETRKSRFFRSHWELDLHNPYSVRPIASCRL